jgi:hypothetical protein
MNRQRIKLHTGVHHGFTLEDGFETVDILSDNQTAVKHYWVDSYKQLYSKHTRYIENEGRARYERGERFGWKRLWYEVIKGLYISLLQKDGWKGGWSGWFLSFFYATYQLRSYLSLRKYEKTFKPDPN